MAPADRFGSVAWILAAGILLPLLLAPFDARVTNRLASRLTDRLPREAENWSDLRLERWLADSTGFAGHVWGFVRFKIPAFLCVATLGRVLVEHVLSPSGCDVVWEGRTIEFLSSLLFSASSGWLFFYDGWVRRVAAVRFRTAQPGEPLQRYLSPSGSRHGRTLVAIAALCFLVAAFSRDYVAFGDAGVLSKRWYQLRPREQALSDVKMVCVGNVAGTNEKAIAVRFRDGSYWTSLESGYSTSKGTVHEATTFFSKREIRVEHVATVWPDESVEANRNRQKRGMPMSPCAELVGEGAGDGARDRVTGEKWVGGAGWLAKKLG